MNITKWNEGKKGTTIHGATGKNLLKYGADVTLK